MAFWDEYASYYLDPNNLKKDPTTLPDPKYPTSKPVIPRVLTDQTCKLDTGEEIDNPLRMFKLPRALTDSTTDKRRYDKPKYYETVRFPLSGLVGTPEDQALIANYNAQFNSEQCVQILNTNVLQWLNQGLS